MKPGGFSMLTVELGLMCKENSLLFLVRTHLKGLSEAVVLQQVLP